MNNKAIFRKSVLGAAIASVAAGGYQQAFANTTIASSSVLISATATSFGNVTVTGNDIYMKATKGTSNQFQMSAGSNLTINAGSNVVVNAQGFTVNQAANGFVPATPTGKSLTAAAAAAGGTTGTFFNNHTRVNTGDADGNYQGTNVSSSSGGVTNTNTFVVDANGSTTTNGTTNDSNTTTTTRTVTVGNGQTSVDTTDVVVTDINDSSNLTTLVVDGTGSNLQMSDRNIHTSETDVYFNGNLISNGSAEPVGEQHDVEGSVVDTAESSTIVHADLIANTNSTLTVDTNDARFTAQDDNAGTRGDFLITTNSASMTVDNDTDSEGGQHGLWISTTNTILSGGTSSTFLTLDDNGAHLSSDGSVDGSAPVILNGVANGVNSTDAVNKSQLDAEATTRANADTALSNRIGNQVYNAASTNNAKIAADASSLTTAINGENTRAIAAEGNRDYNSGMAADGSSLTTAINTEQSQRVAADTTLTNNLATEVTNRTNADAALQADIDDNAAADEQETAARKKADHKLNNRIDDVEGGVAAAIALTSAQQPSAPGKTAVSVGAGFYAGENAIGVNVVHKLANDGNIGVGVAQSSGNGDTAAKLSYGFEF